MDAIANIMNLFIFVFCILFVNIDKTVVCTSVKSIKSLSLSLSPSLITKKNAIELKEAHISSGPSCQEETQHELRALDDTEDTAAVNSEAN